MAIKIMDVPGEKLMPEDTNCPNHDFLTISALFFFARNVVEFLEFVTAFDKGMLRLLLLFANPFRPHLRLLLKTALSTKRGKDILDIRFWSATPYKFGDREAKYSITPHRTNSPHPHSVSPTFLRESMAARLALKEVTYDFGIQFRADEHSMPVDDPSVVWSEHRSPFRTVATIRIPKQTFDTPEQNLFGDNLAFTPWRCLPEHQPLGGINTARREIYRNLSAFRHARNHTPATEPSPNDTP
jgi:hypothetical protein